MLNTNGKYELGALCAPFPDLFLGKRAPTHTRHNLLIVLFVHIIFSFPSSQLASKAGSFGGCSTTFFLCVACLVVSQDKPIFFFIGRHQKSSQTNLGGVHTPPQHFEAAEIIINKVFVSSSFIA